MISDIHFDRWQEDADREPRVCPPNGLLRAFSRKEGRYHPKLEEWKPKATGFASVSKAIAQIATKVGDFAHSAPDGTWALCGKHHIYHKFEQERGCFLSGIVRQAGLKLPPEVEAKTVTITPTPPKEYKPFGTGVVLSNGMWKKKPETPMHPPNGNMLRDEYQFWAGSADTKALSAVCRYCRAYVHGLLGRQMHKDMLWETTTDNRRITAILQCKKRLVIAYQQLDKKNECVICGEETWKRIWGIPICCFECEKDWMFEEHTDWPRLEEVIGPSWKRINERIR